MAEMKEPQNDMVDIIYDNEAMFGQKTETANE